MSQENKSSDEIDYPFPISPNDTDSEKKAPAPQPASSNNYPYPSYQSNYGPSYSSSAPSYPQGYPPVESQAVIPATPAENLSSKRNPPPLPPVRTSSNPAALEVTVGIITFLILLAIIAAVVYFVWFSA